MINADINSQYHIDLVWVAIAIFLGLIFALLYRYEARFIKTLPQPYRSHVIVTNTFFLILGSMLMLGLALKVYLFIWGIHCIFWGSLIWVALAMYNAFSRPKLLMKLVEPERAELKRLAIEIDKMMQNTQTDNSPLSKADHPDNDG